MHTPDYQDHGHSVLAVPVPRLDTYVRGRTRHYDVNYLAADPAFGQAHVTLIAPWRRDPTAADLDCVGQLIEGTSAFDYRLAELAVFADGIIHAIAEPAEPFGRLIGALVELFPEHQPYGGKFGDVIPHVTLDAVGTDVDLDWVRADLGTVIPVSERAEEVQLQWWQAGNCHVQRTWKLGVTSTEGSAP